MKRHTCEEIAKPPVLPGTRATRRHLLEKCGRVGRVPRGVTISSCVAVLCLALIAAVLAAAQSGMPRISIKELKDIIDKGGPVTIIDVQPKSMYDEGHIKGAISLPAAKRIALEDVWSIPSDQLIVTYCDCGPGEADSADAAEQLLLFGYDVKVLADPSIRGWKNAGYPIEKKK